MGGYNEFPFGILDWDYRFRAAPLIGYLFLNHFCYINNEEKQYNSNDKGFTFLGHWVGDDTELVDEHKDDYSLADKDNGWIEISIPLRDEWNREIDEWDLYDKEKLKIIRRPD
jgi:hypothetical protein